MSKDKPYTKHLKTVWQYDRSSGRDPLSGWIKYHNHHDHESAVKQASRQQSAVKSTYAVGHDDHPTHYVTNDGKLGAAIDQFKESLDEEAPTNSMGGSSSTSGPIAGYDPMLVKKKKLKKFTTFTRKKPSDVQV